MEMTVIGVGLDGDAPGRLGSALARIGSTGWTAVQIQRVIADSVGADVPAALPDSVPTGFEDVPDLDRLIADNPGGNVLLLCLPEHAREMTAQILAVPAAAVPTPESGSVTRIRAARNGVRSVICVNDILHTTPSREDEPSA